MTQVILGITGQVGSGKSYATHYIQEQYDLHVIDLDLVGHKILKDPEYIRQITMTFGANIINQNQEIDRSRLGQLVFNDSQKLDQLNNIVHPAIKLDVKKTINVVSDSVCIVGALIDEIGLKSMCTHVVSIYADEAQIVEQVGDKYHAISPHQKSVLEYQKMADYSIKNTYDQSFTRAIDKVMKKILF